MAAENENDAESVLENAPRPPATTVPLVELATGKIRHVPSETADQADRAKFRPATAHDLRVAGLA